MTKFTATFMQRCAEFVQNAFYMLTKNVVRQYFLAYIYVFHVLKSDTNFIYGRNALKEE